MPNSVSRPIPRPTSSPRLWLLVSCTVLFSQVSLAALADSPNELQTTASSAKTELEFSQSEVAPSEVAQSEALATPSADAFKIPARFSASHTSSQSGFDGITGIGGFIPLGQNPGEDVTFIEGDLLVDNGGDFGWNLSLGYRGINAAGDEERLRGGFIGLDGQLTDESDFYQLAAGYESLGKDWDFRLNGYLPLGESKATIRDVTVDTGVQTTSGFQGNELSLTTIRGRQRIRQEEEALGGFDAEVATTLSEWGGGELVGAVGGYLLSGEESSLGGQLRLASTFASHFNAGVALQHDNLFGTSLSFSIGASWPQVRFQREEETSFQAENEVAIRLRDPLQRRQTVAVHEREDREDASESSTTALRNPEEGNESDQDGTYRFVHVSLGGEAGDGTYEAPFSTVEEALAFAAANPDPDANANTIVYVDGEVLGASATIPGFTIPENVRVLSQGPQQFIAGRSFPGFAADPVRLPFDDENFLNVAETVASNPDAVGIRVPLPDSGDGVFPTITGGTNGDLVTMGERTILAGFNVDGATANGVVASNVNNVELRNNRITNAGANGIFLDNVGGNVTLFDNEITGSTERGIFAQNSTTERSVDITIAGYELANNGVGMEFATLASGSGPEVPSQIIAIGPSNAANTSVNNPRGSMLSNSIVNSGAEGIIVRATGDSLLTSSSQEFSFDGGTVDGSGGAGMLFSANVGAHVQELNVTGATISNNAGPGMDVVNGRPPAGATQTASSQELVVRGSTISGNQGAGININLADASAQELVIRGNQITDNAGDGIRSLAQNVSIQEWRNDASTGDIGVSENIISGNGGQGINIDAQDLAVLPVVGVANNQVSGNAAAPGIEVATASTPTTPGSPTACLVLTGNQIDSGIQLTGLSTALSGGSPSFQVQDIANVVSNNNGAVVTFSSNLLGALTTPDATPFDNETGNCID